MPETHETLENDDTATEPETRWLDDDQQLAWRAYMRMTRMMLEQLERDLQRDAGIPLNYYEILVRLSEAPDRTMRMSDLADRASSSRSSLSHAVARLEANGWVERVSCPTDRRGQNAVLTDKGFDALRAAAPSHVDSVRRRLIDGLSPSQLRQLRSISETLIDHFASLGETCPGAKGNGP